MVWSFALTFDVLLNVSMICFSTLLLASPYTRTVKLPEPLLLELPPPQAASVSPRASTTLPATARGSHLFFIVQPFEIFRHRRRKLLRGVTLRCRYGTVNPRAPGYQSVTRRC